MSMCVRVCEYTVGCSVAVCVYVFAHLCTMRMCVCAPFCVMHVYVDSCLSCVCVSVQFCVVSVCVCVCSQREETAALCPSPELV